MISCYTIAYDIIIFGTGPVGLSMAAVLYQYGILPQRIALIDVKAANMIINDDPRSIALAYISQQVLQNIGAWKYMVAAATEIYEIHISRCKHFGRILIRSEEYGLPALGYVIRYNVLMKALNAIINTMQIARLDCTQITMIEEYEHYASIYFADGQKINATIIIQAEGKIYTQARSKSVQRNYNQVAIVSHIQTSIIAPHRAFERFTSEGPLALLPEVDGYALVWCTRPTIAQQLLKFDSFHFLQALKKIVGSRIGYLYNLGPRSSYLLSLHVESYSLRKRIVTIGNAAQMLHPVAGQGFNLGLRDVVVLSKLLTTSSNSLNPIAALLQFSQERYYDRNITRYFTDLVARIFTNTSDTAHNAVSQALLGLCLGLIDVLPPIKRVLVKQMIFGWRC